jgi:hypothetical protein
MDQKLKCVTSYRAELIGGFDEEFIREKEYVFQLTVFDEKGNVLSESTFNRDQSLEHKYVYSYDEKNRIVEEMLIEQDDQVVEHLTMEYNDKDQLVNEYLHYLDGTVDTKRHEYDSQDHLVSVAEVNSDGETESSTLYTIENGKPVLEKIFGFTGELSSQKQYKYTEDGLLSEEISENGEEGYRMLAEYDDKGQKTNSKRYDQRGRLIEKVSYDIDENGQISSYIEENVNGTILNKLQYDATGQLVLHEQFDKMNQLIYKVERTLNEQGKLDTNYVFIDGQNRRPPQDYRIRFEYEYFD